MIISLNGLVFFHLILVIFLNLNHCWTHLVTIININFPLNLAMAATHGNNPVDKPLCNNASTLYAGLMLIALHNIYCILYVDRRNALQIHQLLFFFVFLLVILFLILNFFAFFQTYQTSLKIKVKLQKFLFPKCSFFVLIFKVE